MELVTASGALLERILDDTFTIWSEGLTRSAFSRWNRALMETPWGRSHLRRVALMDNGEVLASAKQLDFDARLHGAGVKVLGIGAVYTPPARRGRGYARALIDQMAGDASARGCGLALLFSEIGPAFYERCGFSVVPRDVLTIEPVLGKGAPMALVRSAVPADLAVIADISDAYARGATFALTRPASLIAFSVARRRLLAGLGPAGRREVEFFVTEEGHRAVAYVLVTRGPAGLFLEECGDRDPSGARMGAMLQALAARAPAEAPVRMRAWLPASLRPPQVRLLARQPADEVMMVKALAPGVDISGLASPVFWQSDVF